MPHVTRHRQACAQDGFSMVELLVTVIFVVLISLLIQGSFLRSADAFGRMTHTLHAIAWSNQEMARLREALFNKEIEASTQSGHFDAAGKDISWTLLIQNLSEANFYSVKAAMSWTESGRPYSFEKESYVYVRDANQAI